MFGLSFGVVVGLVSVAAWVYLLRWHHGFWRADQWLGPVPGSDGQSDWPAVVAIVPARNEVATITRCLQSLVSQDYRGPLSVVLVDDGSEDGTGEAARIVLEAHSDLRPGCVVVAPQLEPGWTGKLAALNAGLREAESFAPDANFVWFTDADIQHGPKTLSRLVAKARQGRDMVSLMVLLHCASTWERLLIPAFVFFFQLLYPFPAVNTVPSRVGGAAGGCILLRRSSLASIGGLSAIRGALIDDCALAEAVRGHGGRLWLGLADSSWSLRPYNSLREIWDMVARTAYTQLHFSVLLLVGSLLGLAVVFLGPPILVVTAPFHQDFSAFVLGVSAWALMAKAYWPTLRTYRRRRISAFALPFATAFYAAMTVTSAVRHWQGRGGQWKARAYDSAAPGPDSR